MSTTQKPHEKSRVGGGNLVARVRVRLGWWWLGKMKLIVGALSKMH